jgi:hypothetical protein
MGNPWTKKQMQDVRAHQTIARDKLQRERAVIAYVVRNLESVGLGPLDSDARVVDKGTFRYDDAACRSWFGGQCAVWFAAGYTVETWREG